MACGELALSAPVVDHLDDGHARPAVMRQTPLSFIDSDSDASDPHSEYWDAESVNPLEWCILPRTSGPLNQLTQRAVSATPLCLFLDVLAHHDPARLSLTRVEDGQRCQGRHSTESVIMFGLTRRPRAKAPDETDCDEMVSLTALLS